MTWKEFDKNTNKWDEKMWWKCTGMNKLGQTVDFITLSTTVVRVKVTKVDSSESESNKQVSAWLTWHKEWQGVETKHHYMVYVSDFSDK